MDLLLKLYSMFKNGLEMILDLWPIKMLAAGITSIGCFLFGGSEVILLAVLVFVILDTMTKWIAITKRYCINELNFSAGSVSMAVIFCQFIHAWKPGYLTSTDLRKCWSEKIFTYVVLIIAAGMVGKLPDMVVATNKAISGAIYATIAVTELFSIMENLEEMGNKNVAMFKQYICQIAAKIAGGSFSMTIKNDEKKDKENKP